VLDASSAGNVLFWGAVTTAKTIETGDTFQVSAGNLTISLA
jgi:2-keto-4-pentenoate hydratase